jgi:hypothetical protein
MEASIICVGTLGFFALLFGFILLMRFMAYRETLALADKGLVKPAGERNGGKAALVWGIIIAALGFAFIIGLWPLGFTGGGNTFPLGFGPWMLVGLLPLFFGLALILIYVLTREEKKPETPPAEPLPPALVAEAEPKEDALLPQ